MFEDLQSGVLSAQFSPDNNFVFASFVNDKPSKIWDVNTGKLKFTLKGHIDSNKQGQFSNDGKYILTTEYDKVHYNVHLWDIKSEKLVHTLQSETGIRFSQFSPNSKYILIYYFDNTLKLFDVKSKKLIYSINTSVLSDEIHFSLNNKFLVMTELGSKTLKIYNTINGKIIYELIGHEDFIFSIHISNDNNFILSSSADGSIIIWDINTGEKLVQSFMFDNKNQMWLLPNGYYMASKAAASKLYYKKGLQTIGFEQLDVKFNRPDKVLEVLGDITGERNTQLLNAYKKAWEKRIRKLEIDTTSFRQGFSVPESNFINRDAITYEQSKQELKLHIKALDSTYRLDRFNVWINEVPVYGRKGISLKSKNTHSVDTTLTVKLSVGKNKIETSVLNVNGIESYRQPLYVNFTPKEEVKEKLFFVGIGVDKYQEEGHDLNYSVKDIKDLSIQLKKKYGNLLEIDTLFNQNVSVSNIMKLKERLQNTTVDDKVIISFSGHGLLSKDLDYYLATHDVNFDTPEQNGLPYEDLEYLLDGIPSRKKLLLIDACHSGELDKEDVESIHQVEQQKEGLKGSIGVRVKKPKMGMKNSFELMKELFNNVDRATGATVISAAAGTQFAQERGELKNGVFTYCILNQLREKETISVSELKTLVGKQVQEITNGLQQPTSRNETIENNWKVW